MASASEEHTVIRVTTRRAMLAVGAAVVAPATVGCEGQGAARPRASLEKSAVLEGWYFSDTRIQWQKRALEDFNKERGASVQLTWVNAGGTSQLVEKIVTTLAAGSGYPDVAEVEISQAGKLLRTSPPPLVALNEYLRGKENDFFRPSFVDPWSVDGKWYGLGDELNAVLWKYRWDILDRVGVKPPFRTWNEVIEAGKKVAQVCAEGFFYLGSGTTGDFHLLAVTNGGGYWDSKAPGKKLAINSPQNVQALELMHAMVYRHGVATLAPGNRVGGDPGSTLYKDAYNTGKFGAQVGPTWRISGFVPRDAPDTEGKWMVQHLPAWSASTYPRTTTWGGTGVSVIAASKHKETAADFVVYEHSSKAILHHFDDQQIWPVYKKVMDDPRLNQPIARFNNQTMGKLLREAAEQMLPFHQGIYWPEISGAVGKHLTAVMRNEKPPKQALDEAQSEARAAIEAAGGKLE